MIGSGIEEQHFTEDMGLFFEQLGLPRMAGRVLGELLICDPPAQSLNDLCEALQVSKSAVSTMARLLVNIGLIEQVASPVPRRDFFRFRSGGWFTFIRQRMEILAALHGITERGLEILAAKKGTGRERLAEAHDMFAYIEKVFPEWLERIQQQRDRQPRGKTGQAKSGRV